MTRVLAPGGNLGPLRLNSLFLLKTRPAKNALETAAAVEIQQGGLRRLFLDDFHSCLEKPAHQTRRLFHRYHSVGDHQLKPKNGDEQTQHSVYYHALNFSAMRCTEKTTDGTLVNKVVFSCTVTGAPRSEIQTWR